MLHEQRLDKMDQRIDFFVRTSPPPAEGIFFYGQTLDSYAFASDLIKSAQESITLIDSYVDESVLTLPDKRQTNITATFHAGLISRQLQSDIQRHNAQYPPIDAYLQQGTRPFSDHR